MDIVLQERMNLKLVKEVQKYPCLYKTDTADYCRRSITDKAWDEVGRVVGWPGQKCKDKFRNIRSVVCRYKRLMNSGIKKRPYYLMEHMRYTFPYIKAFNETQPKRKTEHRSHTFENTCGKLINENTEFQGEVKVESCGSPDKNPLQQPYDDDNSPEQSVEVLELYPESRSPSPSSSAPFAKRSRVDHGESSRRLLQSKNTTQNPSGFNQSEQNTNMDTSTLSTDSSNELQNDPKKMFLLSLLPDVYEMNETQTRKFKRGVVQLVDDILSENFRTSLQ